LQETIELAKAFKSTQRGCRPGKTILSYLDF